MSITIRKDTATLDLKKNSLLINNQYSSDFINQYAFEPDHGDTVWTKSLTTRQCAKKKVFVIYEGLLTKSIEQVGNQYNKTLYIMPTEDKDREFLLEMTGNTSICGEVAFTTQSASLFVIESSSGTFRNKVTPGINSRNWDNNLFLTMKLSHLAFDVARQITSLYANIMYEKCKSDSKIIMNMLSIAKIDSKNFGFNYFRNPGYFGTVRSEVIYLQHCEPVNVTHRFTTECYQELPVVYNQKNVFMSPKSRLITEVGEQVPCSAILANKFKLGENWYSRINGQLIVAPAPVDVDLKPEREWNYKTMDSISEKGIYSQNETDQMNKVITYNLVLPSELNNFIGGTVDSLYSKKSLFTILKTADVDEVKRMFTNRIWSFTSSVGEWVNFFV